jgi:hypothetical protein
VRQYFGRGAALENSSADFEPSSPPAELSMSNRPLHVIQEGCDAGILPGKITDESVIARPAGKITLYLAASPADKGTAGRFDHIIALNSPSF